MKKYECLYIVNINFDSEGISAVVARVEEVLKNVGGELVNTQHWGKRKLAYAINKERYGNYVLMHFQGENPDISELVREFEIESGILHYLTIRLDEFPDFETLAVPQAFEAERGRRPGGRDSRDSRDSRSDRRPRSDDGEADEKPDSDSDVEEVEDTDESESTATAAPEEVEVTEEPEVEEIAETPEAEETAEEVSEESATSEEEESESETPEEEAEKPSGAK